jgi:hypothetical protein
MAIYYEFNKKINVVYADYEALARQENKKEKEEVIKLLLNEKCNLVNRKIKVNTKLKANVIEQYLRDIKDEQRLAKLQLIKKGEVKVWRTDKTTGEKVEAKGKGLALVSVWFYEEHNEEYVNLLSDEVKEKLKAKDEEKKRAKKENEALTEEEKERIKNAVAKKNAFAQSVEEKKN